MRLLTPLLVVTACGEPFPEVHDLLDCGERPHDRADAPSPLLHHGGAARMWDDLGFPATGWTRVDARGWVALDRAWSLDARDLGGPVGPPPPGTERLVVWATRGKCASGDLRLAETPDGPVVSVDDPEHACDVATCDAIVVHVAAWDVPAGQDDAPCVAVTGGCEPRSAGVGAAVRPLDVSPTACPEPRPG